jgi:hypothetical protein
MFYGIIVQLFFFDNDKHNRPHTHARYAEFTASVDMQTAEILDGEIPLANCGYCRHGLRFIETNYWPIGRLP